jgi:hypothetical protein
VDIHNRVAGAFDAVILMLTALVTIAMLFALFHPT